MSIEQGISSPASSPTAALKFQAVRGQLRLTPRMALDAFIGLELTAIILAELASRFIYLSYVLNDDIAFDRYLVASFAAIVIIFFFFRSYGLHDGGALSAGQIAPSRTFLALSFAFMLLISIAYVSKISADFSRGWFLIWYALSCVFIIGIRLCYRPAYRWLARRGYLKCRVAIAGDPASGQHLLGDLNAVDDLEIAGVYGWSADGESTNKLIELGQRGELDEVVISVGNLPQEHVVDLLNRLQVLPIDIQLCIEQIPRDIRIQDVRYAGGVNLLQVTRKPVREWGCLVKAIEDYVFGGLVLLLFSPIFLLAAIAIKIDSPGPVFFRQQRHGYNHRVIRVYKFRTMKVMEDGASVRQAVQGDDRVTRVGRILRRTSLDELPQLINVMRGEMSLVGPRPHAVSHNNYYQALLAGYANRHRMKPGITGLAQIKGFRGPTKDPELMRLRVQQDLEYIDQWSFWLDVEILFKTVAAVLRQRNAF